MKDLARTFATFGVLAACAAAPRAQDVPAAAADAPPALRLHGWFGDHMVLPHDEDVPVVGTASAGDDVAVEASWLEAPVFGRAGADGRFRVVVHAPAPGGPHTLAVAAGGARVVLQDVLAGDLWLGSGQSNMQMAVGDLGGWQTGVLDHEREVREASHPTLRLFTVERTIAAAPLADVRGRWEVCSPQSVRSFSATLYFFGRALQQRRPGLPLGLVASSWGGTVIEAWCSERALQPFAEFAPAIAALHDEAGGGGRDGAAARARAAFWQQVERQDPAAAGVRPEDPRHDDAGWEQVRVPHRWSAGGLRDHDGVAWYRCHVAIPDAWRGQDLLLQLGAIDDMDTVWFAGERVGGTEEPGRHQQRRAYRVPGRLVVPGDAVLAVRVLDTGGEGGLVDDAEALRLSPAAGEQGGLALAGMWRCRRGAALASLPALPRAPGQDPNVPTVLWNGMIAPLCEVPFRGVLWYQGESNRGRAGQYASLFPAMIADWRRAFARELPFCFVQIAPFGYRDDRGETFALRLAQAAALRLPHAGMVVTADVGDPGDIHPRDKQTVGLRLALQALRHAYGDTTVVADGPTVRAARRDGPAVRVQFAGCDGGLVVRGAAPAGFELAGDDGVFHAATATVDGDTVVLQAATVPVPVRVRHGHATTAAAELWNRDGLPLGPFAVTVE